MDLRDAEPLGRSTCAAPICATPTFAARACSGADLRLAILGGDARGAVFAADFRPGDGSSRPCSRTLTWDDTTRWPAGFDPNAAIAAGARERFASPTVPADARSTTASRGSPTATRSCSNGLGVVRLLGIDAPQADTRPVDCFARRGDGRQCGGCLTPGSDVRFTLGHDAHDKFGRALAYVWTRDGRLANQEIVARGDARVLIVPPAIRYEQTLRLAQARAAGARRGLWASC